MWIKQNKSNLNCVLKEPVGNTSSEALCEHFQELD